MATDFAKLDRTKSAAKRAAWKVDSKWDSYNPFSRTTSRETVLSRDAPVGASNYDEEAAVGGRRFGAKKARTFPPAVQEKPSDIGPAASPSPWRSKARESERERLSGKGLL